MKIEFRTHDDKTKLFSKWYLFPVVPVVGSSVQISPSGSGKVTAVTYNYRINTIFVYVEMITLFGMPLSLEKWVGEDGLFLRPNKKK